MSSQDGLYKADNRPTTAVRTVYSIDGDTVRRERGEQWDEWTIRDGGYWHAQRWGEWPSTVDDYEYAMRAAKAALLNAGEVE